MYKNYLRYRMHKKALMDNIANAFNSSVSAGSELTGTLITYTMGAAGLLGIAAGFISSKVSAKRKQDIEQVKQEYANARLTADIGYLNNKLKEEYYKSTKNKNNTAKTIRVF